MISQHPPLVIVKSLLIVTHHTNFIHTDAQKHTHAVRAVVMKKSEPALIKGVN